MESNFQNRVVRRSMRTAVEALDQMNLDLVEGVTGIVPFSMMLRAKELAREIQQEIDRLSPVEADADERPVEMSGLPPITEEDWGDYEDFHN